MRGGINYTGVFSLWFEPMSCENLCLGVLTRLDCNYREEVVVQFMSGLKTRSFRLNTHNVVFSLVTAVCPGKWSWDLSLVSHPKDWRSPRSNPLPLVLKASSLTTMPRRLLTGSSGLLEILKLERLYNLCSK